MEESIVGDCYETGKGGGIWALQGQASQEYYEVTFEPIPAPLGGISERDL